MAALAPSACGDDGTSGNTDTEGTSTGDGSSTGEPSMTEPDPTAVDSTSGPDPDSSSDGGSSSDDGGSSSDDGGSSSSGGSTAQPVEFFVLIENISNTGPATTAISPGVWANHAADVQGLFLTDNAPDPGAGLELLAEDGDPSTLAASIADRALADQSGVFDTPRGGGDPGPIGPGESYMFTFTADPFTRLSLVTKFDESNDIAMGTSSAGIGLFAGNGTPFGTRDVTDTLRLWDVGTEANQAIGQGPNQAPYADVDVGPSEEGVISAFNSSTRAVPQAAALVEVEVDQGDGVKVPAEQFTITLTNVSGSVGTLVTPMSSLLWAVHDDTISLFTSGAPDAGDGLEALAEDGDPSQLAASLEGADGVGGAGTVPGALPGETLTFVVTASAATPRLSFATALTETNDAFLAMGAAGVALIDDQGEALDDEDVEVEIRRVLGAWDAGTEVNQVPGVGPDQAPRQVAANTGAADPNENVRRYRDITNDLSGPSVGGFLSVAVTSGPGGSFDVTITNTSDTTAYPGEVSRVLWTVHDDTFFMFADGYEAEPGLESLAEDGDPSLMLADLETAPGVASMDIVEVPDGAGAPAPLAPGDSYTFTVVPSGADRFLNIAAQIGPSNDTFVSLGGAGLALLDDKGAALSDVAIAQAIATQLGAWDAGTENNQAGAAGAHMGPAGPVNTGPSEGNGLVRDSADDPVWPSPDVVTVLRVTVGPTER
jgi:hypothetical protein